MEVVTDYETLYEVNVRGGGTFVYDTIDVGRFALKMAEVGDRRTFTVKPWTRRLRIIRFIQRFVRIP